MRRLARAGCAALVAAGCAGDDPGYLHNREDYEHFRAATPGLLEPNYLPFMVARVALPEPGWRRALRGLARRAGLAGPRPEALVLCRWPDEAFPLAVHVVSPEIGPELADRVFPRPADAYVRAVERALRLWERALEGRVSFSRAAEPGDADLRIELLGEEAAAPEPDVQVLGATPLGDACRVRGDLVAGRVPVDFRVAAVRVFVADRHGLLLPDQVERIALHEIGHALGMHGHSPIPNDLMFRIVRDRLPRGELGSEDVNSFSALYSLPNGTLYRRLPAPPPRETPPPPGPPRLALAPHVNPRLGFEVQLPEGWTSVAMDQGVVAVDGLTWDYQASFQILVRAYPSLDAYLARHAEAHLAGAELLEASEVRVAGRSAQRFVLALEASVEELTFLESGDGRVLVAIGESPLEQGDQYRAHFAAILASLELRGPGPGGPDREYGPRPR